MNERAIAWDDVKLLLALHRAGTMTAAARLTGQSQPTISRRVRALQAALGQAVFQRTAQGFALTEEGLRLLPHALRMEEESFAMARELAGTGGGLRGSIRVASSDWFGHRVLARWIAEFRRAHPDVTLELLTDTRPFSLARRECDVAFRIAPFQEAGVLRRRFTQLHYGVYCARRLPKSFPRRDAVIDLVTMDSAYEDLPDVAWLKARFPRGRTVFGSNSREAQALHCVHGSGVAVLPRVLAASVPGLREVVMDAPPPTRDLWLGWHQDLRHAARIEAFLAFVLEKAPELGQGT